MFSIITKIFLKISQFCHHFLPFFSFCCNLFLYYTSVGFYFIHDFLIVIFPFTSFSSSLFVYSFFLFLSFRCFLGCFIRINHFFFCSFSSSILFFIFPLFLLSFFPFHYFSHCFHFVTCHV